MRLLQRLCFIVMMSGLLAAQSSTSDAPPDRTRLDNEIQKLTDAMAAQQKAMNEQHAAIAEQQKQIVEQRQEIENLKRQLTASEKAASPATASPKVVNATFDQPLASDTASASSTETDSPPQERAKESPLSIRVGGAEFTPGGFLDLTAFWRSTNVGSGYGTNFFSIPFANTIPGQITETRITAENSRVTLKATDNFRGNDVAGYFEMDFHGNDPTNLNVTSNSSTMRLRQYFVDVRRGKFEFLAGQAWSFLTPNRVGVSAYPSDVFYSLNMDANYQVGLTWTRSPQVRFIVHPNDHWALGLALENPDQFVGQTNQVTFPAAFAANTAVTAQFDAANQTTTPNLHPDILGKIAFDGQAGGKHFHLEGVGMLGTLRVLPLLNGSTSSKTGGGASGAFNLEIFKNFRLVANAYFSDGGGRYIFGSGPDAVLSPAGTLSLVHSGSGIGGFEWQAGKHNLFAAYYGADYFQRNFFLDTSTGAKPKTFIGYGAPGAATANALAANRAIQEPTGIWIITFWKDPQYGALQLINQVSYLTRAPWFVPVGQPKNARSTMVWSDVRYTLP